MSYYDWILCEHTCKKCGWRGIGKETNIRESFSEGSERECPKCGNYFGYIAYPLIDETLDDPRADPADKKIAQLIVGNQKDDMQ